MKFAEIIVTTSTGIPATLASLSHRKEAVNVLEFAVRAS